VLLNGRFEAASESKVQNAKQIVLYALGFLCFSQKLSGKIFDLFRFCVFPCFLNGGVIKPMNDSRFHPPSNWVSSYDCDVISWSVLGTKKLGHGLRYCFRLFQQQKVPGAR
jgi:hypothetical protein